MTRKIAPRVPPRLSDAERGVWRQLMRECASAGVISRVDVPVLVLYCRTQARIDEAKKQVDTFGLVYRDKKTGRLSPNPYLAIMESGERQILRLMKEMGLTPAARLRHQHAAQAADRAEVYPLVIDVGVLDA